MKRKLALGLGLILLFLVTLRSGLAEGEAWQAVAGPYGGSAAALAISPNYTVDRTVFAGFRGQGVYVTGDGGLSWQVTGSGPGIVVDLAISPAFATDHTVFALSGAPLAGFSLYRSTDSGQAWQTSTSPPEVPLASRIVLSPAFASDQTLYLLTYSGTPPYLSTDGGDTLTPADGWFATKSVTELVFSPNYAVDETMFALVPGEGVYRSINGGDTWTLTGLSGDFRALAISPNFAVDKLLISADAEGRLQRYIDGDPSPSPSLQTLTPGGEITLRFSPTFATDDLILAASSLDPGPYRSTNGGVMWVPVGHYDPDQAYLGGFLGGSVFDMALASGEAYDAAAFAATSTGIYRSNNRGETWFQGNVADLPRLTVRTIAAAPGQPDLLIAGAAFYEHLRFDTATPGEYDGSLQRSTDGGQTWQAVSGRLDEIQVIAFSPAFTADQTVFAAAGTFGQHGYAEGGIIRSTDGGQNWTEVFADRIFYALAVSPNFAADQTLWASAFNYSQGLGIYRSTNGGDTWQPLAAAIHATDLVASPNYAIDQTLFAGTRDAGLQRSTDGGQSWTQILPQEMTALAVSPAYGASRTLYAAGRDSGDDPTHLYRSTDGGDTWDLLDPSLDDTRDGDALVIADLAFGPDGSVLAASYYGLQAGGGAVYRSADGGDSWPELGGSLEAVSAFATTGVSTLTRRFYAGTDGGLWQLSEAFDPPAEPGLWSSHGPRGGKGQALAVSPDFANDGLVLAGEWLTGFRGGESGPGIIRSTDGGQSWQPAAAGTETIPYSGAVHAYAFSPDYAADQTIFAATWGGLFKSTDGGDHWAWLKGAYSGPPGAITAVALAPDYANDGQVMALGGYSGLYLSGDGGLTWTTDFSVTASSAVAYSPAFTTDQTAFAGGATGLFRTTSAGLAWTNTLTEPLSALAVSPDFAANQTVFAGGSSLFISDNAGLTWTSVAIPAESSYISALAISPNYATDQTLFAGTGLGLYRSTDGGDTWQVIPGYDETAILSLALNPAWPDDALLLVGTWQGVHRLLTDNPPTELPLPEQGLATLSTGALTLATDESLMVTTATDHGLYASPDLGQNWQPFGLQAGSSYYGFNDVVLSPAYTADQTAFATWVSGVSIGAAIYRTSDGGQHWAQVYSTGSIGSLAISPAYATDQTVFAALVDGRVRGTTDGGDTWDPVGDWPDNVFPTIHQVELPPTYPADQTLFAASSNGFWRLRPDSATWQIAAAGLDETRTVLHFAVSPNYAADQTLLATARWTEAGGLIQHFGVYRSTDGGVNWSRSATGLPEQELRYLTFSPAYAVDQTAYLSTPGGDLYRSLDGGRRWTRVGPAPERPQLNDLRVGSNGAVHLASAVGVWQYQTPAQDLMIDGGFEADSGWDLPQTAQPAGYADRPVYERSGSMRVGLVAGANRFAYSSARQTVALPSGTVSATLQFQLYPVSGETTAARQNQVFAANSTTRLLTQATAAGDAQYVLILNPQNGQIRQTLVWELSNRQTWQPFSFDLSDYAGQTIMLHFGAYNDGGGGSTGLFVDQVSLVVSTEQLLEDYLPVVHR